MTLLAALATAAPATPPARAAGDKDIPTLIYVEEATPLGVLLAAGKKAKLDGLDAPGELLEGADPAGPDFLAVIGTSATALENGGIGGKLYYRLSLDAPDAPMPQLGDRVVVGEWVGTTSATEGFDPEFPPAVKSFAIYRATVIRAKK